MRSCSSRRLASAASREQSAEHDDELVAGVADAEVVGPQRLLKRAGDRAQRRDRRRGGRRCR